MYSGAKRFEVWHIHSGQVNAVDLVVRTCSCRSWQLSRLPYGHVLSSLNLREMTNDNMLYVSYCYKKEALLRTLMPYDRHQIMVGPFETTINQEDAWPSKESKTKMDI
ncbi:Uncharacterized protein Adt_23893 [Abeliophyllum distichum]|uniref:Zinc finger PMZ-type domain-containing protein n=1 Tax=Abeliophyllum distichum TaxID=126358 RepID=A0ABD1SD76_9LAMI